jgi:hypothetical protein
LKRNRLSRILVAATGLLPMTGCDLGSGGNPGIVPESKDPKVTRALIENPASLSPKAQKKAAAKGKGALPPQPPK